jgi:mono/diheme cytochrome c family protein
MAGRTRRTRLVNRRLLFPAGREEVGCHGIRADTVTLPFRWRVERALNRLSHPHGCPPGPAARIENMADLSRWSTSLSLLVGVGIFFAIAPMTTSGAQVESVNGYVGSLACRPCHDKQYQAFVTYAKKSSSFQSIRRLGKELNEEEIQGCYACHTTGYGRPGGFVNEEATPHLKNAGCEVCHGPGKLHAQTRDPQAIQGHLTEKDCEVCHTSERVKAFRYKPLIHGGAH